MNEEYTGVSKGDHSWGQGGSDAHICFVDDENGLAVHLTGFVQSDTDELTLRRYLYTEYTIPVEYVPSLIRALVKFSTDGEIARSAERQSMKEATP